MLNRSVTERFVLLFSLALLFLAGLLASCTSKARSPGATTADAQTVRAIQEKIKADPQFYDQRRHFNVSASRGVVMLEGYLTTQAAVETLLKYVRETPGVTDVVSKLTAGTFAPGGGCGQGQKPCGDICIDQSSYCNLIR